MPGALVSKLPDRLLSYRVGRDVSVAGEHRRVQIVTEVKAQGSDRRLIAHADTDRVRNIVVIALQVRVVMEAEILIGLVKAPQAGEHFLGPRKNVAHVFKNRKADAFQNIRQSNVWKTHLQVVEEDRAASYGKSGERVARSCLI